MGSATIRRGDCVRMEKPTIWSGADLRRGRASRTLRFTWPIASKTTGHERPAPLANESDTVDFDADVARKPGCLHGRARWSVLGKIAGIDFVHFRELAHIFEKHGCFHDLRERGA